MCGICGIYCRTDNVAIESVILDRMCKTIQHRGPDDQGVYVNPRIGLGMRRLSIIDLVSGQQPIWNEDRSCCIVYNGELYNFLDLRPQLEAKGHLFRTRSDTEVILHAYEEWGADCLRRLNGMFAIAIWNAREQTLFLARDRIGEKPLYYFLDTNRLIFASEIKAILADPTVARNVNPQGLANYLAYGHAVAPDTMYLGIHKLPPAHYLLAKNGVIQIAQYWDVGDEPQVETSRTLTEDECSELILTLLDDSVRRRMVADVPVGAFLSGGVDSSTVVALMKRHATGRVKTFSLGFIGSGAYNELADARLVAKYFGTEHYQLEVEHTDLVQLLRTLVYHYDEPFGDAASFPMYLLSGFAREHVTVVLSGDGGDELFGGYRRYAYDQIANFYRFLPPFMGSRWLPALAGRLPRARRIKRALQTLPIADPAMRYAAWLVVFDQKMQAQLLTDEWQAAIGDYDVRWPYAFYYPHLRSATEADHLNRLMYVDVKTWLADTYMEKVDKATMACSLEPRLPLLDYRLVELAFQIPSSYKIKGFLTKQILKKTVSSLIPGSVLEKSKHGFAVPTDPWFRGPLKDYTYEVLLDGKTRRRGYFNLDFVERLWKEHVLGRNTWDSALWLLLNFELWHRIYLDGETV